eukprot:EG_transcript_14414
MTKEPPASCIDWTGKEWAPGCGRAAAHPNARYTTPASQCPVIDPEWENPNGVPICAIVFGGRRPGLVPLVTEALDWDHGVFMGSIIGSQLTAAAEGTVGEVRRDPFAMLPFCGYNMADYFTHWVNFRDKLGYLAPKVFYVNWFRTNEKGQFIWPGFGENSRVLKWITERVDGVGAARPTPLGYLPTVEALDLDGVDVNPQDMHSLLSVDADGWLAEIPAIAKYYEQFGKRLPKELTINLQRLEDRLKATSNVPIHSSALVKWVAEVKELCTPTSVYWVSGTEEEDKEMCALLVKSGTFTRLNEKKRPNSFLCRSDVRDVARVESCTFICCKDKADAGPTNNWADPTEMKQKMHSLYKGCMQGRTMYVIPFCMGPLGSPYSKYGVEITDSAYVVVNMRIMCRIGNKVLSLIDENTFFLKCL